MAELKSERRRLTTMMVRAGDGPNSSCTLAEYGIATVDCQITTNHGGVSARAIVRS